MVLLVACPSVRPKPSLKGQRKLLPTSNLSHTAKFLRKLLLINNHKQVIPLNQPSLRRHTKTSHRTATNRFLHQSCQMDRHPSKAHYPAVHHVLWGLIPPGSLSSNNKVYLRECTRLHRLMPFLPVHLVSQLLQACPRGQLLVPHRLMPFKCNRCIKVRSLVSQIHLLSTSRSKNKMCHRTIFHSSHIRQPLRTILCLKSLRMRPLLTISSPELQRKQRLLSLGNVTLPQHHRQRKWLRRRRRQRRRKTRIKHPSWYTQTMMSALRRKWQGCQGTHSLLKRKLPWHEDTILLQFDLRLFVVSDVHFHHRIRPNQTERAP
jgi:hypothetical protein